VSPVSNCAFTAARAYARYEGSHRSVPVRVSPGAILDATITPDDEGLVNFAVEDRIGFLLRRGNLRHVLRCTAIVTQAGRMLS